MSSYLIKYSATAEPIERVTLADTTTTKDFLHSILDRKVGSDYIKSFGTTSTNIKYATATSTTSYVALSDSTIFNSTFTIGFLFIKILSAASSQTPEILVSFDDGSTYLCGAYGVGDFILIGQLGDSQGMTGYQSTTIQIKSPSPTGTANIEILIGVV